MAGQGRKRQLVSLPGTAAIPSVADARLGYREERSWPIADLSANDPSSHDLFPTILALLNALIFRLLDGIKFGGV
jgi:hypothetical protein